MAARVSAIVLLIIASPSLARLLIIDGIFDIPGLNDYPKIDATLFPYQDISDERLKDTSSTEEDALVEIQKIETEKSPQIYKDFDYAAVYIDQQVYDTYDGNVNNANKILSSMKNFELKPSIIALSSLYKAMKAHGHLDSYQLIMLASKVKNMFEKTGYEALDEVTKKTLQNLKDVLPITVVNFVWSSKRCTLQNGIYNEFLYAEKDDLKPNEYRRNVYTWINYEINMTARDDLSNQYYWDFETVNDGEYFTIKNVLFPEYLYASREVLDKDTEGMRRSVFTTASEVVVLSESLWRVIPTNNGKHFTLQNSRYEGELLFASGNMKFARDSQRGGVFTSRSKNVWDLQHVYKEKDWSFACLHQDSDEMDWTSKVISHR